MTSSTATVRAQIDACLFDMDGLLIDSENVYTIVSNQILAPYGKQMTWDIKRGLMGRPANESAKHLIEQTGVPLTPQELLDEMDKRLPTAFGKVQPLPGALELVRHLARHKVPIAIATGSKAKNYEIKTAHLEHLFSHFGVNVLCGDDPILAGKGKPDPTIFIEAAKKLGVHSAEARKRVLVFEDGVPGVQAARAAGMEVVWVPDRELLKVMPDDHGLDASQVLESLAHFRPEEWGLPAF